MTGGMNTLRLHHLLIGMLRWLRLHKLLFCLLRIAELCDVVSNAGRDNARSFTISAGAEMRNVVAQTGCYLSPRRPRRRQGRIAIERACVPDRPGRGRPRTHWRVRACASA